MDSPRTVLIVAPDEELRRSIAFALEAEGLRVATQPSLPANDENRQAGFACLVVDEDALEGDDGRWASLPEASPTTILLVDRLRTLKPREGLSTIDKPLLGQVLVDAVIAAVDCPTTLFGAT